jgi:cytochrome c biogenesis protein CcmG/thiol:disulfide interchange protein DsbE
MTKRLLFALPLLAFAIVAIWFAIGLQRDPQRLPSALIDKPAPEVTFPPLEGIDRPGFGAADLRNRVTLVNVFASWCAPCREEHPLLMRLARERRVALIGVSYKDDAAASRRFLVELGNPYGAIGFDRDGRRALEWGVYGVPETFVVDRRGHIRHRHVGALTPAILDGTIMPLLAKLERE